MMVKPESYSLPQSFAYAFQGICRSFLSERNLRIHLIAVCYVAYFSSYYELSRSEYAVLFLSMGVVISCELLNTSIESAVDLCSPLYSGLAKTAKDAAAGAVLTSAIASAAVGFCLFWDTAIIAVIGRNIVSRPFVWCLVFALTVCLIALPERVRRGVARK